MDSSLPSREGPFRQREQNGCRHEKLGYLLETPLRLEGVFATEHKGPQMKFGVQPARPAIHKSSKDVPEKRVPWSNQIPESHKEAEGSKGSDESRSRGVDVTFRNSGFSVAVSGQ